MEKFTGQILLITGERGSGKTLLCRRVVEVARKANWQVRGLLSPGVMKGDEKVGIGVEDLSTGKRYMLARPAEESDANAELRTEKWVFDTRCVSWCNTVLEQAVPCDLLVVDEVGKLELEQNTCWTAALPTIDSAKYHLALVVIRPELLSILQQRWPKANTISVSTGERIDHIVDKLMDMIMESQGTPGEVNI